MSILMEDEDECSKDMEETRATQVSEMLKSRDHLFVTGPRLPGARGTFRLGHGRPRCQLLQRVV